MSGGFRAGTNLDISWIDAAPYHGTAPVLLMCSADKREKDEQREQDALNKAKKKSLGDEIRKASLKTMGSVIDAIRTANKRATAAVRKYKVGGGKDDDGTEKPFGGEEEDEEIVKEMQEAGGALSSVGPRHRMRPNIEAMRALKEAEVNTQKWF